MLVHRLPVNTFVRPIRLFRLLCGSKFPTYQVPPGTPPDDIAAGSTYYEISQVSTIMPSLQDTAPGAKSSKFQSLNPFTPFLAQPVRSQVFLELWWNRRESCHPANLTFYMTHALIVG